MFALSKTIAQPNIRSDESIVFTEDSRKCYGVSVSRHREKLGISPLISMPSTGALASEPHR